MEILERLSQDPANFAAAGYDEAQSLTREQLEEFQLAWIRRRFAALHGPLGVLNKLARSTGITGIDSFQDLVPLLLPHTVFKSYPLSWIETGRFDRLTRWLGALTTLDLSRIDCRGIESIDSWIQRLDHLTELRIVHTFGTTGKLSLVPHTRPGWKVAGRIVGNCIRDWYGRGSGPDLLLNHLPMLHPSYRFGAGAIQRGAASAVDLFAGGDGNSLFLYPNTRFSADVASLAGRLQAAQHRADVESPPLSPRLQMRQREFAERERHREDDLKHFFQEMIRRYRGQNVYMLGVWPVLYDWAQAGLEAGLRGVFGPSTVLHTGGGMKGRTLPEGWRERIFEFVGVERHHEFYAMSELAVGCPRCEVGNYHVPPVLVPMVLHPETGKLLPRSGRVRGRFAAFDLLARHSWGGIVSGDEVTLGGWDETCACGRKGAYVEADIRRYSATEGGSDKISCAAANDAYERATEYLAGVAESVA